MAIWQLHVLGEESFLVGSGRRIPLPDISWMLLGTVLAAPRRSMSRGRLAAELWPDSDEAAARHCLATTLWRIRQRLDCRDSLIDARDDLIALVGDRAIWIDALAFERRAQAALDDPASLDSGRVRAKLRRALALYAGDFLPRRMNDLIAIERERLRALYLDAGYETTSRMILRLYQETLVELEVVPNQENPKGELQELLQAGSPEPPRYELVSATGPDHSRYFECSVQHGGEELGRGTGRSKKLAESSAAAAALHKVRERGQNPS